MKVLMILANPFTHDPRVYNEAKSLIQAGHDVTVLAWDKSGKHKKSEQKDGINIVRSRNSDLMNMLPYDIMKLHLWWMKGYKDALNLFKDQSFDIIHCHDLSSLPIGVRLKRKFKVNLIFDAHEIFWYMISDDVPKIIMTYTYHLEKILCAYVDLIITVNDPVKSYFQKISNRPIHIVMNAKPILYDDYFPPNNKKFSVLYLGGIDRTRHLIKIVDAVDQLTEIQFLIGGSSHDKEYHQKLKEKCNNSDNCEFIGKQPMDKVITYTFDSDIVIHMATAKSPKKKWPIDIDLPSRFGLPNKLFESMVAGRPIIVPKGTYEAKFVTKIKNGIAVDATVEGIKNGLETMMKDRNLCEKYGKNALHAAKQTYHWGKQAEELIAVYDSFKNS